MRTKETEVEVAGKGMGDRAKHVTAVAGPNKAPMEFDQAPLFGHVSEDAEMSDHSGSSDSDDRVEITPAVMLEMCERGDLKLCAHCCEARPPNIRDCHECGSSIVLPVKAMREALDRNAATRGGGRTRP